MGKNLFILYFEEHFILITRILRMLSCEYVHMHITYTLFSSFPQEPFSGYLSYTYYYLVMNPNQAYSQDSEKGRPFKIFRTIPRLRKFVPPCFFTQLGTPSNWSKCQMYDNIENFFSNIFIYFRQIIENNFHFPQNFGRTKAPNFRCRASQDTRMDSLLAISLILTHPVNFPCGRKPEKNPDFRNSLYTLFPCTIRCAIQGSIQDT